MIYDNATSTAGKRIKLRTDGTFTLAFCPNCVESTPVTLRAFVCEKSLSRLAEKYGFGSKAAKALALDFQKSAHGLNKFSVQIFNADGVLVGDFNL